MSELPGYAQALMNPALYPDTTATVELVQTQMSFVFLTDNYVYKVKKTIDLGYVDYTSLEKRKFFCDKEIELNRRLCSYAYLEVVPIYQNGDCYSLQEPGEIVEYAVKMRRLPGDRTLDVLLNSNSVSGEMVEQVARTVAAFHKEAATSDEISRFGNLEMVTFNNKENFTQTEKYINSVIPPDVYYPVKDATEKFISDNAGLFNKRVADGKIKDCHGDLHAAHICFDRKICIFDCIEFNDRFRYCDIASEIAFLAMDLDKYKRRDLSDIFVDAYVRASGDSEIMTLMNFYKCYRACVRAKVNCFQLDDPAISEEAKELNLATAQHYFSLAWSYAVKL